ncbi:MAG TPA: sigma-70 family RNA polymerase sigma factor [Spirochaetia bacterium]|nr:sigma-70 family RNA polymerase sigma factor [Spirochaetia bacterium]
MTGPSDQALEQLMRDLAPRVLGVVARRFRDFEAAEDAVQEAMVAASTQWRIKGLPDDPRAWLTRVAFRRMVDQIRSESSRRRREVEEAAKAPPVEEPPDLDAVPQEDDTLTLLFMCCHPSLSPSSAIALTLRAVGGLTTAEIAHAFLVPEATMAQRISRAKQTIKSSGVRFQLPEAGERAERLRSVLHILYLMFNEGYTSSAGVSLRRDDLATEAIRLTRMVRDLQPNEPEVAGLLALMLLTDARREARTGPQGELIPLTEQDRSLWDREAIEEGTSLISEALRQGAAGTYQLQAAIAALHDEAAQVEETNWPQILALYELLKRMSDNPVIALNHAIAAATVHGPAAGLQLLEDLAADPCLAHDHHLEAARAHLLEIAGEREGAIEHYRAAAAKTENLPERNYLLLRAARLSESLDGR